MYLQVRALKHEEPKVPVSQLVATAPYLQNCRENQRLRDEKPRLQKEGWFLSGRVSRGAESCLLYCFFGICSGAWILPASQMPVLRRFSTIMPLYWEINRSQINVVCRIPHVFYRCHKQNVGILVFVRIAMNRCDSTDFAPLRFSSQMLAFQRWHSPAPINAHLQLPWSSFEHSEEMAGPIYHTTLSDPKNRISW